MSRKTKVRIVGDPLLAEQVLKVVTDHFELVGLTRSFDRAVGRDYSHSDAEGMTIYLAINKPKEAT